MKILNSNEANAVIAVTAQEQRDIKEAVYRAMIEADISDTPQGQKRAQRLEKIYEQL